MRFYLKQQVKKIFIRPTASHEQLQNAANAAYVNEFTDKFEDGFGYFNSRTWRAVIEQEKDNVFRLQALFQQILQLLF